MARITISGDQLNSRPGRVGQMLRVLRPYRGREGRRRQLELPCAFCTTHAQAGRVIAARDSRGNLTEHYRHWRFRTLAEEHLWGQYFEWWLPLDQGREWCLKQASLTILRTDPSEISTYDFVALHCEPDDDSEEPIRSRKRGPHLHVVAAEQPIPKAHIPLILSELDQVMCSLDSLTQALEDAVAVIKEKIVERCV